MPFEFRPAKREGVDLLIGLAGGTGSGKTYTAMRLATGLAGGKKFAVIDTENGRALHYADFFQFDHAYLRPPFTPEKYAEAITAAAKLYPAVVVDSMSHEYAGEGGVLEMQEAEHKRLGGGDNVKLLSWAKPKQEHKRMVNQILQCRSHLVLCFRAESKIEIAKEGNRTVVREKEGLTGVKGWFPVTEKNLAFELTVSLLLLQDKPGVPVPIKLQEQHKHLFPIDQPIAEESGIKIAEWAAGQSINWVDRIESARTKADLAAIVRQLQLVKSTLPESAHALIRTAYEERLQQLTATKTA
jgi:hypothetical protein